MVAYNFQVRFADVVASGEKRQTIRAPRKGRSRHAYPGEYLQLYTGMRTKKCRKLVLDDPTCTASLGCLIDEDGYSFALPFYNDLSPDCFAKRDGFLDYDELLEWFSKTHGLPFPGHLIAWDF